MLRWLLLAAAVATLAAAQNDPVALTYGAPVDVLINGNATFFFSGYANGTVTVDVCSAANVQVYLQNLTSGQIDSLANYPLFVPGNFVGTLSASAQTWPAASAVGNTFYLGLVVAGTDVHVSVTWGGAASPSTVVPQPSPAVGVLVTGSTSILLSQPGSSWLAQNLQGVYAANASSAVSTTSLCGVYAYGTQVAFHASIVGGTSYVDIQGLDVNTTYTLALIVPNGLYASGILQLGPTTTKPIPNCVYTNPELNPFCSATNQHLDPTKYAALTNYTPFDTTPFAYYVDPNSRNPVDDASLRWFFANFSQSLSQYPCDAYPFSFVRTCGDCLDAYTLWLCDKYVPHCSDTLVNATNFGPTGNDTNYNYIKQPCISRCWDAATSCPFQMGIVCPKSDTPAGVPYDWTCYVSSAPAFAAPLVFVAVFVSFVMVTLL